MKKIPILLVTAAMISGMADSNYEQSRYGERSDHETALNLKQSADIMPLEQIIARAKSVHPGRILETELERKGDRYIYELEILDQGGRVWEMKYDAKTGELIKDKQDD